MKLGFFNLSSAMLNLTQLINAGGYLGGYKRLGKHLGKIFAQRGNLTQRQLRILTESGVINDLGLETTSTYDKHRVSLLGDASMLDKADNALNKTMWLFQKMDTLCRAATTLAAYEQARVQGKSKENALEFAADLNRTAPLGKIFLQFQKYPVKQLELLADMAPWNSKTSRAQKINFRFPYILTCGLMGFMPFFDWGDKLANKFNFFPKDFLEEVIIEGSQEIFGEDAAKEVSRALLYGLGATANIDMSSRAGLAGFNMAGKRGRTNSVYDDFGSKLVRAFGFHSANESAISDDERIPQRKQTAQGIAHKAPTRERRNAKEKTYSRRAFLGQRSEERPPRLSIS